MGNRTKKANKQNIKAMTEVNVFLINLDRLRHKNCNKTFTRIFHKNAELLCIIREVVNV